MSLDMNAATPHRRPKGQGLEYGLYFALILAISVPTALVRSVLPNRTGRPRGFFLTEAWAMAQRATPQIFAVR